MRSADPPDVDRHPCPAPRIIRRASDAHPPDRHASPRDSGPVRRAVDSAPTVRRVAGLGAPTSTRLRSTHAGPVDDAPDTTAAQPNEAGWAVERPRPATRGGCGRSGEGATGWNCGISPVRVTAGGVVVTVLLRDANRTWRRALDPRPSDGTIRRVRLRPRGHDQSPRRRSRKSFGDRDGWGRCVVPASLRWFRVPDGTSCTVSSTMASRGAAAAPRRVHFRPCGPTRTGGGVLIRPSATPHPLHR